MTATRRPTDSGSPPGPSRPRRQRGQQRPSLRTTARALVLACHPGPALAVTLVAMALAAGAGRGLAGTLWTTAAVATGQLSIGWSNDLIDRRRDAAAKRRDKPVASGVLPAWVIGTATVLALVACVPLSLANGLAAGTTHLVAVASAWTYNLGLKRTVFSVLPYAVSFGLLPSVATLGLPGSPWAPAWATVAGALLGLAGHAANVAPDVEDDLATGVRGLPQRLGATGARRLAAVLLVAATAVLVFGPPGMPGPLGWAGLTGAALLGVCAVVLGRDPRSRTPLTAILLVAALDVLLLLAQGTALS